MGNMADGLNFEPRVREPESAMEPGMAAPAPRIAADALLGPEAQGQPPTPGPGPYATEAPASWQYDFDPGTGSSRATFNGEVNFTSGGSATAGVTTWNGRTGAVTLTQADVTAAGGAPIASPAFTGNPTAPTPAPGDADQSIATTAFVGQAIAAASPVSSFNGRTGAVTLTTGDVSGAGGLTNPNAALTGSPTTTTPTQGDASGKIASTQFVANALASGAVTSWNGRAGAVTLSLSDVTSVGGAPIASPNFTGQPTGPTPTIGDASQKLATTAFVTNAVTAGQSGVASFNTRTGAVTLTLADVVGVGGAPLASPNLTGTPTAPTPTAGDATTKLATTAFVTTAIGGLPPGVATFNGRQGTVTLQLADVTSVGGAPLASPAFTGTPTAPTPAPGDNSTRVADTAFVAAAIAPLATTASVPVASAVTPKINGTAAIGTDTGWSKGDHVHPTDTTRAAVTALAGYLPITGGTLAGALTIQGNPLTIQPPAGGNANLIMLNAGAVNAGGMYWDHTNNSINVNNGLASPGSQLQLNSIGDFVFIGSANAYKTGGGAWAAASDARIKTVEGDYPRGLDEVLAVTPVVYRYKADNGEATAHAAASGQRFVGFVAQDIEAIFPDMVTQGPGTIGGQAVADLRSVDVSNLVYALVNAVKTLAARIEALEGAASPPARGVSR
jgi:Chaperone of endosialidase